MVVPEDRRSVAEVQDCQRSGSREHGMVEEGVEEKSSGHGLARPGLSPGRLDGRIAKDKVIGPRSQAVPELTDLCEGKRFAVRERDVADPLSRPDEGRLFRQSALEQGENSQFEDPRLSVEGRASGFSRHGGILYPLRAISCELYCWGFSSPMTGRRSWLVLERTSPTEVTYMAGSSMTGHLFSQIPQPMQSALSMTGAF